jgi:hypothetical protein
MVSIHQGYYQLRGYDVAGRCSRWKRILEVFQNLLFLLFFYYFTLSLLWLLLSRLRREKARDSECSLYKNHVVREYSRLENHCEPFLEGLSLSNSSELSISVIFSNFPFQFCLSVTIHLTFGIRAAVPSPTASSQNFFFLLPCHYPSPWQTVLDCSSYPNP